LATGLEEGIQGTHVKQAQKILRYLGYYRGRTNGIFDSKMTEAVSRFQIDYRVIASLRETGVGRIGPMTREAMLKRWKVEIAQGNAKSIRKKSLVAQQIKTHVMPNTFLSSGDRGVDVRKLQAFLIDTGYLPAKDRTGTFGARTTAALLQYQIDRSIIANGTAKGAGVFGPSTKLAISRDLLDLSWKQIRAQGLSTL
jgi:peptidoglycan hydrolase-like protein with peptidoglycan-binding domain